MRIQYRTPTQLGLLERFHRTLKEEEVYWRLYDSRSTAGSAWPSSATRYNDRRPHWALVPEEGGDVLVPVEVYRGAGRFRFRAGRLGPRGAGEAGQDDGGAA